MSDAAVTPVTAYLIAPPEDAPQVAGWHSTLAGVGVTCNDTWASLIVSDASTVDAAAVWDWTQDAATLSADWTAQIAQIQAAHIVAVVTATGTYSTVQVQVAQYAIDSGIPLIYCGPTHDFLAVQPIVVAATTLAGCKTWVQTMVSSTQIQAALNSPNASLMSVRNAVTQYISPPVASALDAGALDAQAKLGATRTPAPPGSGSAMGAVAVAAAVVFGALAVMVVHRRMQR